VETANYHEGYVYCVGGKGYYPNFPVKCWWLTYLPVVAAMIVGDWRQLFGVLMVALGLLAANARFSPVHGCLVWIPLIALAIWTASRPEVAVPLIAWGAIAWLAGCIECRLTLVPHAKFNSDSQSAAEAQAEE
jgi:hypothetical protein